MHGWRENFSHGCLQNTKNQHNSFMITFAITTTDVYKVFSIIKHLFNMQKLAKEEHKELYFLLLVLPIHSQNSEGLSSALLDRLSGF
ncbi:hypothetical protein HNQ34_001313 [Anoxybacillus tepidamans]|uniref:Uncharacterized protein n=1 Tax=Anoxybacteroides tepidamans TaxID=265948 RepID=A0A7W8IPD3_9BACL|nr:hypothetical protein [Anoxybacillus tepidamans]